MYPVVYLAGDVVSLVEDMVDMRLKPDGYTYAAVLNACQRANEAELAFEVFRWALGGGHVPSLPREGATKILPCRNRGSEQSASGAGEVSS